ncbi:MAG TPA: hypothetical protein VMM36_02980 [Opitutaceae bacterium]|nr:hypothetical protein [Opitutaceae bacterium]
MSVRELCSGVNKMKALLDAVFRVRWHIACAVTLAMSVWQFSMFHTPGKGFTVLATIGDKWTDRLIPELKAIDIYLFPDSWGYDGMGYAQIAMVPDLRDPELAIAIDNLPYRARRILFCWTAWLAGGGDPERALLAFTVQNGVAWLLLAFLLFRWLPPVSLENFVRWIAILFSFGICFSLRRSLVDGPSLLLIACGIALAEKGRPWLSALVLGGSGLGKETNLIAAAAMDIPTGRTIRDWVPWMARGIIVALPLALWVIYLWTLFGRGDTVGSRNFDLPFAGFFGKWRATFGELSAGRNDIGLPNLYVLVSLTAQMLFFALRPRWKDRWWRLGAAMSLLMLVLGEAVWEGYPSAAARVLLPMLLAFNIALPRGWRWSVVLVLGNLSILDSQQFLRPVAGVDSQIEGPVALRQLVGGGEVKVSFEPGWHEIERSRLEYWRWSSGSAGLVFTNPHDSSLTAEVRFDLRSREPRATTLTADGRLLWSGTVTNDQQDLRLEVTLPPGETRWWLETTMPALLAGDTDERVIAFSLRNFKMKLLRRAEAPPGE